MTEATASDPPHSQPRETQADPPRAEKWSTAHVLGWLQRANEQALFKRDGQPAMSSDLERVAEAVHASHLRTVKNASRWSALRLAALVPAGLVASVALSVVYADAWGMRQAWWLAVACLQMLTIGLASLLGVLRLTRDERDRDGAARGIGHRIQDAADVITWIFEVVRDRYPVLWCLVPELGAAALATALCVLGDRLHDPPVAAFLLGAIPLAFCAVVFSPLIRLPFAALLAAIARVFRAVPDPVDNLIDLLFRWTASGGLLSGAYSHKKQWPEPSARGRHRWGQEPHDIWEMEAVARALETDFAASHVPWGSGAGAWVAAEEHGHRIAAWVRRREDDLLMSVPGVQCRLACGLLAICDRRWTDVEADPAAARPRRFMIRMLPRILLASAFAAAAAFVPDALGLEGPAHDALAISLAIVAVNALVSPGAAFGKALEKVDSVAGAK